MAAKFKLLIIEGDTDITLYCLYCLKRSPTIGDIHVISRERTRVKYSRFIKSYHVFSWENDQDLIDKIAQIQEKYSIDILVPIYEKEFAFVAQYRDELLKSIKLVPTPSIDQFYQLSDKSKLSELLKTYKLPAPDTLVYSSYGEFYEKLNDLEFPVLLKPSVGRDGKGIIKFETIAELKKHIANNQYPDRSFIVQSFVDGYDIDCSVLYKNGNLKAHTIQKSFITNNKFHFSPGIEFLKRKDVLELVDKLMTASQYNGVAHLDLRYDSKKQQCVVIEVNCRFWGSILGSLITAKVNFPLYCVLEGLDVPFEVNGFEEGYYMTFKRYFKDKRASFFKNNNKVPAKIGQTSFKALLSDPNPKLMLIYDYFKKKF